MSAFPPSGFVSYKNTNTVAAEVVYQFLYGMVYGAAWGCVTPFPAPGSAAALAEAKSGVLRIVPPFGSLAAVPANAIYFGSILGFQRLCSKTMELLRRKEDYVNDVFGFGMIWPYYHFLLNHSEQRLIRHNRIVGGVVLLSMFYANIIA